MDIWPPRYIYLCIHVLRIGYSFFHHERKKCIWLYADYMQRHQYNLGVNPKVTLGGVGGWGVGGGGGGGWSLTFYDDAKKYKSYWFLKLGNILKVLSAAILGGLLWLIV